MKKTRKNLSEELKMLQNRLRSLLQANMEEARRTAELLRSAEQKVEDRFGHLDSLETTWEIAGKKFRKDQIRTRLDGMAKVDRISNVQGSL